MTLTASLPTKALASVLAALLLSTTLAVALPTKTELPSVLSALDVAAAEAHTQQSCRTETLPVQNRHGTATSRTYTRTVCVNVDHSHAMRDFLSGAGITIGCAIAAPTGVGAVGCSLLIGGAYIGAMANQSK